MSTFPVELVGGWPVRPVGAVVLVWEGPNGSTPGLSDLLKTAEPVAVARIDDDSMSVLEPFQIDPGSDWNPLLQLEFARDGNRFLVAPSDGGWWLLDAVDLEVTLFCAALDQLRSAFGADAADGSVVLGSWLADDVITPEWQTALEELGRRYDLPVLTDRSAERARAERYAARLTDAARSMDVLRSPYAAAQQVLQVVATFKPVDQLAPAWHEQLRLLSLEWALDPASREPVEHNLRELIDGIRPDGS